MTTEFAVIVAGGDREYARQASEAAFREIDHIEGLLSRFNACSDVSQINLLKPGDSIRVAAETMECLLLALWVYSETRGAFDITVGHLVDQHAKNASEPGHSLNTSEHADQMKRVGMTNLLLNPDDFTVGISSDVPDTGLSIDLGGIGKGFAVDRAADVLAEWDISDAIIHGGASTALALGHAREKERWPLGIGGIWGAKAGVDTVFLSEAALSGSGKEVKGEHVIDPGSGRKAEGTAAWAIAPSAAVADGLSTAFMVMPDNDVLELCNRNEGLAALVVTGNESILKTGIQEYT